MSEERDDFSLTDEVAEAYRMSRDNLAVSDLLEYINVNLERGQNVTEHAVELHDILRAQGYVAGLRIVLDRFAEADDMLKRLVLGED